MRLNTYLQIAHNNDKLPKRIIHFKSLRVSVTCIKFVCVQVLRPNQSNGVMSSVVSLPNHMHFFRQKLTAVLLESTEGRE